MSCNVKVIFFVLLISKFANSFKVKKHEDENFVPRRFLTETYFVDSSTDLTLRPPESSKVIRWKSINVQNERNVSNNDDSFETTEKITLPNIAEKEVPKTRITWRPLDNINTYSPNTTDMQKKVRNVTNKQDVCERFKYSSATKFDYEKMANVWQTVYYQLPEKVQCFKIHIKRISEQEKQQYSKTYGNFSGIVNWNECNLEIKAAVEMDRKHFLQGINEDEGVMDNIIIIDDKDSDGPKLQEESADQWLVVHDMLLLRDCDTGGVVIFSKVPYNPRQTDLEYALKDFNEEYGNGKMACDDEEVHNRSFVNEEELN